MNDQEESNSNANNREKRKSSGNDGLNLIAARDVQASKHGFLVINQKVSVVFPNFGLFAFLASKFAWAVFLAYIF